MRRTTKNQKENVVVSPQIKELNKTEADIKELTNLLNTKKIELKETGDEYIAVSNKLEHTQEEYNKFNLKLQKIQADVDSLNSIKEEKQLYINSLDKRKEAVDKELLDYKSALRLQQDEFKNNLDKEKTDLLHNKRCLESEITSLQINIEHLNNTIDNLKKSIATDNSIYNALCDDMVKIEAAVVEKTNQIAKLEKDYEKVSDTLTEQINFKSSITKAIDQLKRENEDLEKENRELTESISTKKLTMGKLFIKEEKVKEQAHMLKDFYNKNGIPIPNELNF